MIKTKAIDWKEWRAEDHGTLVKMDGKYYDLADGSLDTEPAADGIYSAEALLCDIEEYVTKHLAVMIYLVREEGRI